MAVDQRLQATVEGDELVIRIGLDTLKMAAEWNPLFATEQDGPWESIEDTKELAHDVCRAMTHEEEDGSSPLTNFVDQAVLDAAENGSIGFAEK